MAHPGLCREMDDPGDRSALPLDRRGHRLAVRDVGADEGEGLVRSKQGQPGLLEAHVVIVVQIVHAEDAFAARQQRPADMEADEAGGAGHEDRHRPGGSRRPGLVVTGFDMAAVARA